jgi:hypothetical protein
MGIWEILMVLENLYVLIDYVGHPAMNEDYLNKRRLDTLNSIVREKSTGDDIVIVSIGKKSLIKNDWKYYTRYYEMFEEIKMCARKKMSLEWIDTKTDDICVSDLIELLKLHNYHISPEKTVINIGGTNLLGCILFAKQASVKYFAKFGFKVNIVLPMCAEGENSGINDLEKMMKAFSRIYEYLKTNNLINNVNLTYRHL